jgi:hypothetical protein
VARGSAAQQIGMELERLLDPGGSDPDGSDPDGSDPDGSDPDGTDPSVLEELFVSFVVGLLVPAPATLPDERSTR